MVLLSQILSRPTQTTNQDVKQEVNNSNPARLPAVERVAMAAARSFRCRPLRRKTVEQQQAGYLNFGTFSGAIKNHLGTFKRAQGSLRNVPFGADGMKSFPEKVRSSHSLHDFYGSVGHISILCL